MPKPYLFDEYHRRQEDRGRYEPGRTPGERYQSERGFDYGPQDADHHMQRRLRDFDRDREGRGFIERAGDEVRSWFGDEEAEQRRRIDERNYWLRAHRRHDRGGRYHLDEARARDVMTRGVVTVYPWETVERAARLMDGCNCGVLPVVNNHRRLIGVITDRDITLRTIGRGIDPRQVRIGECMSDEVYACYEDESIKSCMSHMARHQVRRMPILDDHDRLIGIISQGDLAWLASNHPGHGNRRAVADLVCAVSVPTRAHPR
jgi:CBS domain-containing protein